MLSGSAGFFSTLLQLASKLLLLVVHLLLPILEPAAQSKSLLA